MHTCLREFDRRREGSHSKQAHVGEAGAGNTSDVDTCARV